jgi:hypothetical protein
MNKITSLILAALLLAPLVEPTDGASRPPAVPLVTYNPFLSIWSEADHLNDASMKHWTRHDHSLVSLIRIDGKTYRLMGAEPTHVPAFTQTSVEVLPARSIYEFEDAGVHVTMTFMEPALQDDLDVYSWPLSYITWNVRSIDGAKHKVEIYDSTSSQLAVNKTEELVEWSRETVGDLTAMRVGTKGQPVLGSCGDDHRINGGYAYAAAPRALAKSAIGANDVLENSFAEKGELPAEDDKRMPRAASDAQPVMAFAFDLGSVGTNAAQRQVVVAYDEILAIKYFGKKLLPYWARNGVKMAELLQAASKDFPKLLARCEAFDKELMADMTRLGTKNMQRSPRLPMGSASPQTASPRTRTNSRCFSRRKTRATATSRRWMSSSRWIRSGFSSARRLRRHRWFTSSPILPRRTGNSRTRRTIWERTRWSSDAMTAARACRSRRAATC